MRRRVAAAKTIGQVLWDDLNFEREFYLIPRDTYRTHPAGGLARQVPLDRWKQLGADGAGHRHASADTASGVARAGAADRRRDRRVRDGQGVQRER